MKSYYDIVVNFDEVMYYFYEWEDNDSLDYIKVIPLIRVSKKNFKNILMNKIKLEESDLYKIKKQTHYVNGNLTNALIISDNTNSIVLEFNDQGEEIAISTLEVSSELDINELTFSMKNYDLKYSPLEERTFNTFGRKDVYIKKFLKTELEELYESSNESKLFYFYLELFKKKALNFKDAYEEIKNSIDSGITKEHYYIYDLMLLSHKKSGLSN